VDIPRECGSQLVKYSRSYRMLRRDQFQQNSVIRKNSCRIMSCPAFVGLVDSIIIRPQNSLRPFSRNFCSEVVLCCSVQLATPCVGITHSWNVLQAPTLFMQIISRLYVMICFTLVTLHFQLTICLHLSTVFCHTLLDGL